MVVGFVISEDRPSRQQRPRQRAAPGLNGASARGSARSRPAEDVCCRAAVPVSGHYPDTGAVQVRTCLSRSGSATRGEGTGSGREPGPCQRGLAQREQAGTSRLQTYPFCWFRKKTDNVAVREKERGKESAFNEAHFNWFRDGHTSLKTPRRKKQDYF